MTLNQIIARLRTLALSHEQINNFYFGDKWEFDSNGEIKYPGIFVETQPGNIDRVNKVQVFNFRIYFMDLVKVSEGTEENETEVLSDMSSVCSDFLAMLYNPNYQDDWLISESNAITPFTEALNDMVAGVYADLSISVDFVADICQVPSDEVIFENPFDMARTRILSYDGTGTEGDSFVVPNLAGKIVIASYRAGNYRRVITTTPTDFDKIKVTGTELGTRKGILSSDGTTALQSGDALIPGEVLDFILWE